MNNCFATSLPCTGYVFTRDYYIRITERMLSTIQLVHAHSERDDTVLLPDGSHGSTDHGLQAGYTEWVGQHGAIQLSLGWDWVMHNDGFISGLHNASPRTNLLLLGPGGYDPSPDKSTQSLWAYIDTLPWQQQVIQAI
jgi:hypothetical protein